MGTIDISIEFNPEEAHKALALYLKEFYSDPSHWSNNKRRRNGLPLMRKPLNDRVRTIPSKFVLFEIIKDAIGEIIPKVQSESFSTFASAEEAAHADHETHPEEKERNI